MGSLGWGGGKQLGIKLLAGDQADGNMLLAARI